MSPTAVVLVVLTAAAFPLLLWAIGRTVTGNIDLEAGFEVYAWARGGLRVAELAERAGVASSTVRFYERAGLCRPRGGPRAATGVR